MVEPGAGGCGITLGQRQGAEQQAAEDAADPLDLDDSALLDRIVRGRRAHRRERRAERRHRLDEIVVEHRRLVEQEAATLHLGTLGQQAELRDVAFDAEGVLHPLRVQAGLPDRPGGDADRGDQRQKAQHDAAQHDPVETGFGQACGRRGVIHPPRLANRTAKAIAPDTIAPLDFARRRAHSALQHSWRTRLPPPIARRRACCRRKTR